MKVFDKILEGLLRIIWAAFPAMGMLSVMQIMKSPLYIGVGFAILTFLIFGMWEFVLEIKDKSIKEAIPISANQNIIISFDSKEIRSSRVHEQALRLAKSLKGARYDIEVAGLLHLFLKACGVTQQEMDDL